MVDPWYRETDAWRGELRPRPGTNWHLIDPLRSTDTHVFAACGHGLGDLVERRDRVLIEIPLVPRPGMLVPTPGRGATCARCLARAVKAAGPR